MLIKLGCGILLAVVVFIVGLIPLKYENFKSSPSAISISNAFAGGLFLAIGLIHLMPEAQYTLDAYY